jgi:methyl-accepting chemotaxis protein
MLFIKSLRFRTKIVISFASVLVVMCALGAAMYAKLGVAKDGVQWTTHTYKVLAQLDAIMASMVDQETGLRAFLLAGETVFLEPYEFGMKAFDTAVAQVETLTDDNPRAQSLIAEVKAQGLSWRADHAEVAIALMMDPSTVEAAQQSEISGDGKQQMDAIRALIAEFKEMESGLLAQRSGALDNSLAIGNMMIFVSTPLGVFLALLAGLFLARCTDVPLRKVTHSIGRLADGDLSVDVFNDGRRDEIGDIQTGLVALKTFMQEARANSDATGQKQAEQQLVVDALQQGMDRMAALDLSHRIDQVVGGKPFPAEYESLRRAFNGLADTLSQVMSEMLTSSETVARQTEQLNDSSQDLSNRAETQAATLEQSAAALQELGTSVTGASKNAADAEAHTRENQHIAEQTGDLMRQAMDAMGKIKKRSDEITQIISVIDDIAFQTNLLALNAGVEAARAGEAGRGFSVVASEVRLLAQRSAESAQTIKGLITSSSAAVESGGRMVEEAGTALETILSRVSQITAQIAEISKASREQANGIGEVNLGMRELDNVTQKNAAMATEVMETSSELASVARTILDTARKFEIGRPPGYATAA